MAATEDPTDEARLPAMTSVELQPTSRDDAVRFGRFCLLPSQRLLLDADTPVQIGHRALDILLLLVERAGEFVVNDEIFRRVWPRSVVVDGNLRVHIAALRKVLGSDPGGNQYIVNVPNRGYRFVADVVRSIQPTALASESAPPKPIELPAALHRIIGRASAVGALSDQVAQRRLVTLVGAGGIGKTTVAGSVAQAAAAAKRWSAVHFVDLGPIADPQLVSSALAATLGLSAVMRDAVASLLAFLHDKCLLIILDNCEHVATEAAVLAEAILRGAPQVHILATSREPLRADGEWVQRLPALDLPESSIPVTAREALAYGAIELFVDRASANLDAFAFADDDVPKVVEICRRLDGIPLAIELAAARVDPLGIRGIAAAMDDCFAFLSKGRRTALPRHQTLQATLDWSFRLLSVRDQLLLLRLSVFTSGFSLEAASALAAWGSLSTADVLDGVADLAAKSLLSADVLGDEPVFRLLETTRAYASARLTDSADAAAMQRKRAEFVLELMIRYEEAWRSQPTSPFLTRCARHIDDVRAALAWAMSARGDLELGLAITAKAAPLMFQMSLTDEHRAHCERALEALRQSKHAIGPEVEFELNIVYGNMLFHTRGIHAASRAAFSRALTIAESSGDNRQLALAYSTCWMSAYMRGEPLEMLAFANKFEALIAGATDPGLTLLPDRMKSPTLHFLGDQRGARAASERSLAVPVTVRSSFLSGAQIDRRVSMGTILSRVMWLQGLPDQADRIASETIEIALREGEAVAVGFTLAHCGVPIALLCGDLELARRRLTLLMRHTLEHSLLAWRAHGRAFETILTWLESGREGEPVPLAFDKATHPTLLEMLGVLHSRHVSDALIARAEAGQSGWCRAELLRVQGERIAATDASGGEALLVRSLELARQDGTLSWELRTSTSLARLWADHGRLEDGLVCLETALNQVSEGFATPAVANALALYGELGSEAPARPQMNFGLARERR